MNIIKIGTYTKIEKYDCSFYIKNCIIDRFANIEDLSRLRITFISDFIINENKIIKCRRPLETMIECLIINKESGE